MTTKPTSGNVVPDDVDKLWVKAKERGDVATPPRSGADVGRKHLDVDKMRRARVEADECRRALRERDIPPYFDGDVAACLLSKQVRARRRQLRRGEWERRVPIYHLGHLFCSLAVFDPTVGYGRSLLLRSCCIIALFIVFLMYHCMFCCILLWHYYYSLWGYCIYLAVQLISFSAVQRHVCYNKVE